jgi:large subunit ribosomal protein L6
MSRIGKMPVVIPAEVKVEVKDRSVSVEGPKGKLSMEMPKFITAKLDEGKVVVERKGDSSKAKAMHGLGRSLLNNLVQGVSEGFVKKLEIHGVGFKAAVQGRTITMNLGYSHPVTYDFPEGVSVKVEDNTKVTIEGPDKWAVGLVASELRSFYPPEPYKGKGVRYSDERVERKEGKTVQ